MNRKHQIFYKAVRPFAILYAKWKFGYKYTKAENLPENYIVLSNHVTDFDMIFLAASFPRQMYFVGSEHIARLKWLYKFLKFGFAPIMRYKGTVAASTVVDVLRKVKKGENVCIFAEGVRTWDGVTAPILPSTAKLIKKSGCGLVTYKIVGGYFSSPMWSCVGTRKGHIHGAPVQVYTKEQLKEMSVDEIYKVINDDLYEDAYARQLEQPIKYKGKHLAEQMENLLYICPSCGSYDTFRSEDDAVCCKVCQMQFHYNEYGMLEGAPFQTVREFAAWQKEKAREDVTANTVYSSPTATLASISNHVETLMDQGKLTMSTECIKCGNTEIAMKEILDVAMHGRRALVFSTNEKYYELIPEKGSNVLKYFLYFEEYKKQSTTEKVG